MLTNLFQSFLLLESQCLRSLNKQIIFQSKIKDREYIKYIKDSTKMQNHTDLETVLSMELLIL